VCQITGKQFSYEKIAVRGHRSILLKNASGISYETTGQVAGEGEAAGTASYSQATALTID
jgi:hypothetical protein